MTKTVFVSIIGKTNAGKSSLLNAIIGEKIASVSPKPQTTRTRITGILTKEDTQFIFIDTPGIHRAKTELGKHMLKTISGTLSGIDVILYVLDCTRHISDDELEFLKKCQKDTIMLVNKIDLIRKEKLLPIMEEMCKIHEFKEIIPISVVASDGIDSVIEMCKKYAKDSPFYFPEDKFTDQPEKVLIAETVREKLLRNLSDELPHGIAVVTEKAEEINGIFHIDVEIFCERNTHKAMIIGKNGALIKKIGTFARQDLEDFFGIQVNLKCWVKVKENWRNNEFQIKNFGLS